MEVALDAGAEDVKTEDGIISVLCAPHDFEAVKSALESKKIRWPPRKWR